MPTLQAQISAGADDAYEMSTGVCDIDDATLLNVDGANEWNAFRFTGITLPAGAVINTAYLSLYFSNSSLDEPDVTIYGEDVASPSAFAATMNNISGRTRTTASVDWGSTNLGAPGWFDTADISTIAQELFDTHGPYDNGVMAFMFTSRANDTGRDTLVSAYESGAANAAKLYIDYTVGSNEAPTIVPNTADETTFNTGAPTLEFTGSDTDGDDLRYQVQINTSPDFLPDGVQVTDSEVDGGTGQLVIHPGPAGGLTWEGHQQVDDRPGQVFQGKGGVLDKIEFSFGPHESAPGDTDGYYLCRVYSTEGVRGDNVPVWQASTAYTLGQMVRQTSGANANQQFLYICTASGTSGSTEPTWTEVEDDTINDGSVVWEAHRGAGPLNYADPADTPTPGWLAQSDVVAYSPGAPDGGWKTCSFTGSNRIRLTNGAWYCAILDWRPNSSDVTNTLTVAVRIAATHGGNCYIDGSSTSNNGPRVGDDTVFRAYEDHVGLDKTSGADAGFANTEDGGDTDPFNAGETISYTVQAADELAASTYYWRARVLDPGGLNQWSDWTTTRTFAVTDATIADADDAVHAHTAESPTLTQAHGLVVSDASHEHEADTADLTQAHSLAVAEAGHDHTAESTDLTQAHSLAVAEAGHDHTAESTDLTQVHELVAPDAEHGHSVDAVELTQAHSLVVAASRHDHVADSVDLAQLHSILVAGVLHGHSADNVVLQVAGTLAVEDALHEHIAPSVTLIQAHQLLAAVGLHGHSVDNVTLTVPVAPASTGALMVIAGAMGRLFSRAAVSNLHGARLAAAARGGMLETALVQAPALGMAGSQLAAGPVSGQLGGQLAHAVVAGNQGSDEIMSPLGGQQGRQ